MAPKKKIAGKVICEVCGDRPATHESLDKKQLCDVCEKPVQTAHHAPKPVPEGAHIVELFVENIMKVRVAHIKPKSNVVQVTGKNGAGKTSVLRAIAWALTGTTDVPSQPIRAGQRVGTIRMDLGDLVVTRYFTRVENSAKGNTFLTKLMVEGKKREQFRSPQGVLDELMGKISFDPLAFTRMDDKKQLETLRGLVKFDIDIDELDRLQKTDYEERTVAGREKDSIAARVQGMTRPAEDLPAAPIDVTAITERLQGAANHNTIAAAQRQKRSRLREEAEHLLNQNVEHEAEIERLKRRIVDLTGEIKANSEYSVGKAAEADAMEIPADIDTAEVAAELTAANATNGKIAAAETYRQATQDLAGAREKWETLDKRIKDRAAERTAAIARAGMPIDGLSIGDGEVLYQGLPFGQASNAEQIRVSMALAMASNPKLRVLRISDGSLLDSDSMELITAAAEAQGFQVWIERVDSSGTVGVVMEDGEASGEDVVTK